MGGGVDVGVGVGEEAERGKSVFGCSLPESFSSARETPESESPD